MDLSNQTMKIIKISILCVALSIGFLDGLYAAPSNGTRIPSKAKIEMGYEYNIMFERPLRRSFGNLKTQDNFYTLSLGIFDWLSLDGKIGLGDASEKSGKLPSLEYNTGFAGGYGFRIRAFDNKQWGIRAILGGQHICVHPQARSIDNDKYEAILDDWQGSALVAKDFKSTTIYAGISGSDCQIVYKINNGKKKRVSSDSYIGLITGAELYLFDGKARFNIEGRFFSETALSTSTSWLF